MRFVDKDGEITISRDLINIENPQEYKKKQLQSIMLDDNYSFGIYHGKGDDGVKYYFIENKKIFPDHIQILIQLIL